MKSLSLFLLVCTLSLVIAQGPNPPVTFINGYGNIGSSSILTIDLTMNFQFKKPLNPIPPYMYGNVGYFPFSNLLSVIYANSSSSISWAYLNYKNGYLAESETFEISTSYKESLINGVALFDQKTFYFLGTNDRNQVDLVTTSFGPSSSSQVSLPITLSSGPTQGALDNQGSNYFVVSIINKNQYECTWVNTTENQVIKTIKISPSSLAPDTKFQIYAYNKDLYIVQCDPKGQYVQIYRVDWSGNSVELVYHELVANPPDGLQISLTEKFVAIFTYSLDRYNPSNVAGSLIKLSSFSKYQQLNALPYPKNGDKLFIF
ncbi:hypothetical protein CYY_000044 [Polysphondylium violaceum]|uniref:Uncharacterized protein n=1 Tax=Polysphondylium violaceum TaxID=133409 RepID=A0A8J4V617_9MYCE|nr:hypothetical protein CYY_000044 [Polysphondylium violaceum]